MRNYIGIDCGLDGGIVKIDEQGEIVHSFVMPTLEVQRVGKSKRSKNTKRKIDIAVLHLRLKVLAGACTTIIIENPGAHAASAAGLRSMTYSFAVVEALCVALHRPYHTVSSQDWQKAFWIRPKPKPDDWDTKAQALAVAKRLWPGKEWRVPSGKTGKLLQNPHDGLVDGALLAEWGRIKKL